MDVLIALGLCARAMWENEMQKFARAPAESFGPFYPKSWSANVTKFRNKARDGLAKLSAEEKRAYGAAILQAVLAAQRSALMRETPTVGTHCASGTWINDAKKLHKALQRQQRAALFDDIERQRRDRDPDTWKKMYDDAMKEKNGVQTC